MSRKSGKGLFDPRHRDISPATARRYALKPAIRLSRELWLAKQHDVERLAGAAPESPSTV